MSWSTPWHSTLLTMTLTALTTSTSSSSSPMTVSTYVGFGYMLEVHMMHIAFRLSTKTSWSRHIEVNSTCLIQTLHWTMGYGGSSPNGCDMPFCPSEHPAALNLTISKAFESWWRRCEGTTSSQPTADELVVLDKFIVKLDNFELGTAGHDHACN